MTPLQIALWEVQRHVQALQAALVDWRSRTPPKSILELEQDADRQRLADQILFRFIKLQDAMGGRLISASLAALAEPYEDWPMRDRIDRLERLGLLDAEAWLAWREIRNHLAHEYPDQPEVRLANLLAAISAAEELGKAALAWRESLDELLA